MFFASEEREFNGFMRLAPKGTAEKLKALHSRPMRLLRLATGRRKNFPFFPLRGWPKIYGRIGGLVVRLARSAADVKKAQRLRFEVFYKEMSAVPDARTLAKRRDEDEYDAICDHLLVIDKTPVRMKRRPWPRRSKVVGTYRVLRQEVAESHKMNFYTQGEYDIAPLMVRKRETHHFMEQQYVVLNEGAAEDLPFSLRRSRPSTSTGSGGRSGMAPHPDQLYRRHEASGALLASVIVKPIRPAGFNTVSPGISAFVASGDGTRLGGSVGELAVAAPFLGMTQAFWEDRERYLDTYWRSVPGLWIDGDLAVEEADGHFFLLGRSDDTIKVAGKRLGPAEVEDVLLEMPGVSEAAAIGIEDAAKGQRLVVFVVPATTSAPEQLSGTGFGLRRAKAGAGIPAIRRSHDR